MGRLVRIPGYTPPQDISFASLEGVLPATMLPKPAPAQPDDYLMRLGKYVPAEVLGLSLFVNAMLEQAMRAGGPGATMAGIPVTLIATAALVVGLIGTPLFVWCVRQEGDAWITHAIMSTCLFPVWAYAFGAVAFAGARDGNFAAILLASFTVCSGLISPPAERAQIRIARMAPASGDRPQLVEVGGKLSA